MEENNKQKEFTEDFLRGLISDVVAGSNEELKTMLGDKINEVKQSSVDAIEALKKPVEMKAIHDDMQEEGEAEEGSPKPFKNFGEQALAIYKAANDPMGNRDAKLRKLTEWQSKAVTGLGEGVAADGGFLVQTDFSNEMLRLFHDSEPLMNRARVIPISSNSNGIKIPAIDETSRADGSRLGGVRGYWADEGATKTASKPKFRQVELTLKKLIGLVHSTDELLQDSAALGSFLSTAFTEEFRHKINDAMYNGDGAGKPSGVLNSPATVSVAKKSGQAAATVVFENIVNMWSRAWARGRGNAVWNINQDIEPQLFSMSLSVGSGGVPVYMPAGQLSASPFGQLMGRPVMPIEACATLGTVGDIMFNDWSQYIMISKGGIDSASSIHVGFATDQTAFRFVMRVDGQSWWNSSLTPFKGTNTQGPFVKLATRA